jgi:putative methyltransferase (TIGR04325 family)
MYYVSFTDESTEGPSWLGIPRRAMRALAFSSLVKTRYMARYERHFASAPRANLFRGVYASFAEAAASAPESKPLGYDNPGPAAMYRNRTDMISLSDYPILLWMTRALPGSQRLFDLGGHVGLRYYSIGSRLDLPEDLVWQVMDVPAVVEAGRALAREKGATRLVFTETREDVDGADILYATGSLQYLERPVHEMLAPLSARPRHVLINQTPMQDGPAYYTLQSIGTAFCPYRIFNRERFLADFAGQGYRPVDHWENAEKACYIPFHPERSLRSYDGWYLRLE